MYVYVFTYVYMSMYVCMYVCVCNVRLLLGMCSHHLETPH